MSELIVEGERELKNQLIKLIEQFGRDDQYVSVSFSQDYAVYVHEDMEAYHKVGQAKFLTDAAARHRASIASDVEKRIKTTNNVGQALYVGGLRLQRESQKLTPVDTGALRASAQTELEK